MTPHPSSIGQGLNPQPSDREPSALPLDHSFRLFESLYAHKWSFLKHIHCQVTIEGSVKCFQHNFSVIYVKCFSLNVGRKRSNAVREARLEAVVLLRVQRDSKVSLRQDSIHQLTR